MENIPLDENLDPIEHHTFNMRANWPAPTQREKVEHLATNLLMGGATPQEAVEKAKEFYRLLDKEPAAP